MSLPEIMREVALYHDYAKIVEDAEPEKKGDHRHLKERAVDIALQEIEEAHPNLKWTERDKVLFRVLHSTCDYFGYNLSSLELSGGKREDAIDEMFDVKIEVYIDTLADEGIKMDPEILLELQYALNRADSTAIPMFRKNSAKLLELKNALMDRV